MEVLIYLVPMALALGLVGLGGFLWSLKSGQYDDLDGAAWRAIMDEDELENVDRAREAVAASARPPDRRSPEKPRFSPGSALSR